MLTFEPAKDRWKLGFKEAVLASFDYLGSYGLECVQAAVTFVRYDSPNVFVNVFHGRGSYDLGVEVGRHGDPRGERIGLDALLGWQRAPEGKVPGGSLFQSDTREGVQEKVPQMAALFRKYADSLLRGDAEAFKSFDEYWLVEARRLPFGEQSPSSSRRNTRAEPHD